MPRAAFLDNGGACRFVVAWLHDKRRVAEARSVSAQASAETVRA
jgi:hypothetical protein